MMHDLGSSQATRLTNLRQLIEERFDGKIARFCALSDKPQSMISGILSSPPRKRIGERLARDIERNLGLESGWLDKAGKDTPKSALSPSEDLFLLAVRQNILKREIPPHILQTILYQLELTPVRDN